MPAPPPPVLAAGALSSAAAAAAAAAKGGRTAAALVRPKWNASKLVEAVPQPERPYVAYVNRWVRCITGSARAHVNVRLRMPPQARRGDTLWLGPMPLRRKQLGMALYAPCGSGSTPCHNVKRHVITPSRDHVITPSRLSRVATCPPCSPLSCNHPPSFM